MNLSIQSELQLFAEELHQHLTPSFLEKLARELAFVQRKRKFSGRDLAIICVWISQRVASDSKLFNHLFSTNSYFRCNDFSSAKTFS